MRHGGPRCCAASAHRTASWVACKGGPEACGGFRCQRATAPRRWSPNGPAAPGRRAARRGRRPRARRGARPPCPRHRGSPGRSARPPRRAPARWPRSAPAAAGRSGARPPRRGPSPPRSRGSCPGARSRRPPRAPRRRGRRPSSPARAGPGDPPIASAMSARCAASSSSPSIAIVAPVERRERPVEVGERDQRVERAGLRSGPERRRQHLRAEQSAGVDERLAGVQAQAAGDRGDRVVRDGEDHEIDVVHQGVGLGERPGARHRLPEPLAADSGRARRPRPPASRPDRGRSRARAPPRRRPRCPRSGARPAPRGCGRARGRAVRPRRGGARGGRAAPRARRRRPSVGVVVASAWSSSGVLLVRGRVEVDALGLELRAALGVLGGPALGALAEDLVALVPCPHPGPFRSPR